MQESARAASVSAATQSPEGVTEPVKYISLVDVYGSEMFSDTASSKARAVCLTTGTAFVPVHLRRQKQTAEHCFIDSCGPKV